MERIGMVRDPKDDFEHPGVPDGNRLRAHVLYWLSRGAWESRDSGGPVEGTHSS